VIARDITDIRREAAERQRIEIELRRSLDEKVVLLREIHHRVKNNLQVIASLLNLQSANADSDVQQVFAESQNRVHAIALVHELLYRAADLAHIELDRYLANLVMRLVQTYGTDAGRVTVTASAPDIHLDIDTAVPCGLMVNELVSNALKHGFPDGRRGKVEVAMDVGLDGNVVLTVRDDGVGLPGPLRWEEVRSLGLQIVGSLAKQLKGTFRIWSDHGTIACVSFPPAFSERLGRPSIQAPPPSTPQPSSSRPSNGRARVAHQGVRQ
jgi:two-component sensor histidine kinase